MKALLQFLAIGSTICLSAGVMANEGSMIGGGEVTLKAVVVCDASGIDTTFPVRAKTLEIAYEAGWEGAPVPNMTIKVITRDDAGKVVRYYQTDTSDIPTLPTTLTLYSRTQSSGEAEVVGILKVSSSRARFANSLRPTAFGLQWGAEELILSNCSYVANAQF